MKETETWHQYCALRKTQGEIYSIVAMATILAPVSFSERRTCPKHTLGTLRYGDYGLQTGGTLELGRGILFCCPHHRKLTTVHSGRI